MLLLRRFLIRLLTMADHAVRRGGRGLRGDPRRARRSDRHDAAARRQPGRHRPAARALRPRQVARSSSSSSGSPASRMAISAPRSRCGRTCSAWCIGPAAGDARARHRRAADRACDRRTAGGHRRARARHGGRGRHRRRQWRGALHPRFPVGPGVHPAVRRADAGLRDLRPRLAAPRPALRHAVLSVREHRCACASTSPGICSATCSCRRWRWRCRWPPSSRSC